MLSKKTTATFGSIVLLIGIVGGVIAVEERYTKSSEFCLLAQRVDRKILRDDIQKRENIKR